MGEWTAQIRGAKEAAAAFSAAASDVDGDLTHFFSAAESDMNASVRKRVRTKQAAKAMSTFSTSSDSRSASMTFGDGLPWAFGAEFGSKKYHQFPEFKRTGTFVFPGLKAGKKRRAEGAEAIADNFVRKASN